MKRITAIALTAAALLGTSYVGNVGATEVCDQMVDTVNATAAARDAGITADQVYALASHVADADTRSIAVNVATIVYAQPDVSGSEIGDDVRQFCENKFKEHK